MLRFLIWLLSCLLVVAIFAMAAVGLLLFGDHKTTDERRCPDCGLRTLSPHYDEDDHTCWKCYRCGTTFRRGRDGSLVRV